LQSRAGPIDISTPCADRRSEGDNAVLEQRSVEDLVVSGILQREIADSYGVVAGSREKPRDAG